MTEMQLDIYGGEAAVAEQTRPSAPFTPAQREIMQLIRTYGSITSSQAGVIMHAHRADPCARCAGVDRCPWLASDGLDAMKRLRDRGIVKRARRGVWTPR